MTTAEQMADELYGLHCDIGRLEVENARLHDNLDLALDSKRIAERRVTELLDENARLRSCLSDDADNARQIMAENAALHQQLANVTESMGRVEERCAKLRELVLALVFCANDEADCDQCPMNGARCDVVQQCFCDGAAEALRELGIEAK